MNIGNKIKTLRLQKTVTQEQLAEHMKVSPQAVSKWENGVTLPDIMLLPELAAYFGVSIDELFRLTDEKEMERIENMLDMGMDIPEDTFEHAEQFLKNFFFYVTDRISYMLLALF